MTHRSAVVLQATVTIAEIDPPIWRRLCAAWRKARGDYLVRRL